MAKFFLTREELLSPVTKGPAYLVAWALAIAYVVGLPALVKPYWSSAVAALPEVQLSLLDGKLQYTLTPLTIAIVAGGLGANVLVTIVGNLFLWPLYAFRFPAVERYKISEKPWPWALPEGHPERERFWATFRWSLWQVPFNNIVVAIPSLLLVATLVPYIGAFSMEGGDSFPSPLTIAWQIAVCSVVEDAMFYWSHRTLHHPRLYPHIHKWHHAYNHPIALSSEAAHPFEFLIGNLMPVIAGPLLLRCHMLTLYMWIAVRIAVSVDEHCGYAFPWSPVRLLPFGATAEGHDFHHSHNTGIFASQYIWWDRIMGTDKPFLEWQEERAKEAKKAH